MPVRLHFVVEGPTERRFVENILRPHLADHSILVAARCVETSRSRGRKYSGGIRDYTKAKRDIERWMGEDQNSDARFTTMFDLYALPGDFPGYEDARQERDPYARIRLLEDALVEDISDRRFVPYLQLHEFEALLFCDPQKLEVRFDRHSAGIGRLAQVAEQSNPELINDGNETAPSKRIIREIPEYESDKASSGPIVAERIGLTTLRTKCQHFAEWLGKLEALTQGS